MNGPFEDDPDLETFNADWKSNLFIQVVTNMLDNMLKGQ